MAPSASFTPTSKITSAAVSPQPILNRVRGLVVAPNGRIVYAASVEGNSISWYTRNAVTGKLMYSGHISKGSYAKLAGVFAIAVSQDGKMLYAATGDMTVKQSCMLWFAITASNGALGYTANNYDCHRNTGSSGTIAVADTGAIRISPDQTKV